MKALTPHPHLGWLHWRFWLASGLFWLVIATVGLAASFALNIGYARYPGQPYPSVPLRLLYQLAVVAGYDYLPRWVATPILFEVVRRTEASARPLIQRWRLLVLTVLLLAVLHASLLATMYYNSMFLLLQLSSLFLSHAGILAAAFGVHHYRASETRRREVLAAQLRALRAQLQPHFLFNTLQTIASHARTDADATVRMIALLGDLLRQTLRERSPGHDLVPLREEHDLLRPYLELQQLRFADRLQVAVEIAPDAASALVPDLLLQPLVENALRHGIEQKPGPGRVIVRARRDGDALELVVADDGPGPQAASEPAGGIGLTATRQRLAAHFGDAASLDLRKAPLGGTEVTLRLPWREAAHAA